VRVRLRRRQRGFVVIVALVAVLVMALSAAALLRSAETTMAVTGNLGFMQSSLAASDHAVEHVVAMLFELRLVADTDVDDPAHGYFASRQPGENSRGVPRSLQAIANYPPAAPVLDAGEGNAVRFVVERMCLTPGPPAADNCVLSPAAETTSTASVAVAEPPQVPLFRLSVRVDGAAGASQFVQAWLADLSGRRRIAWRALAD
jgi:molybdopterin-biosynthesis enzyme MoeA-like protein